MTYDLITILGPTASGKTPLAAALAHRLHTEIISGDSRQVYRRMDLGTGKDLADYVVDGHRIPYHLIDIAEPGTKYNVFRVSARFPAGIRGYPFAGKASRLVRWNRHVSGVCIKRIQVASCT